MQYTKIKEALMTKPQWGVKRKCLKCDTFFYDMRKEKFVCPKCGETYYADTYEEIKNKRLIKIAKRGAPKLDDEELDEEALLQMTEDIPLNEGDVNEDELDILDESDEMTQDRSELSDIMENFDNEDKNGH